MTDIPAKRRESAVEHALQASLHPSLEDRGRKIPGKGVARDGPVTPSAHPEPGRDAKAQFEQGLGEKRMKQRCRRCAPVEEMLNVDERFDMLALPRRRPQVLEPGMKIRSRQEHVLREERSILPPARSSPQRSPAHCPQHLPDRAIGARRDVCRRVTRVANIAAQQRVDGRGRGVDRAEDIVAAPAVDQQIGAECVGRLGNGALERREQRIERRTECKPGRGQQARRRLPHFNQLKAERARDSTGVLAFVAVARGRDEVDAGTVKPAPGEARGDDRGIKAAREAQHDLAPGYLTGDHRNRRPAKLGGGVHGIANRGVSRDEGCRMPRGRSAPSTAGSAGQEHARHELGDARKAGPLGPQEGILQPVKDEGRIDFRVRQQAKTRSHTGVGNEGRRAAIAAAIDPDGGRGIAIGDRFIAGRREEREIAPVTEEPGTERYQLRRTRDPIGQPVEALVGIIEHLADRDGISVVKRSGVPGGGEQPIGRFDPDRQVELVGQRLQAMAVDSAPERYCVAGEHGIIRSGVNAATLSRRSLSTRSSAWTQQCAANGFSLTPNTSAAPLRRSPSQRRSARESRRHWSRACSGTSLRARRKRSDQLSPSPPLRSPVRGESGMSSDRHSSIGCRPSR